MATHNSGSELGVSATRQLQDWYSQWVRTRHHRAHAAKRRMLPRSARWFLTWRALPALHGLRGALTKRPDGTRRSLPRAIRAGYFCGSRLRGLGLDDRYDLQLILRRGTAYLFQEEVLTVLKALNEQLSPQDTKDLENKQAFFSRCRSAGLPTIPILAEFIEGRMVEHLPIGAAGAGDLFSKYANGIRGKGAAAWRYKDGAYSGQGETFDLEGLKQQLARLSKSNPIILQDRISNHPDLLPISGKGLSTARIMTVRRTDGSVEMPLATFRMAAGDAVADNFALRGIAAPIDLETGTLGAGTSKRRAASGARITHHPDSGAAIKGCALPHWQAAKALALAAHAEFATMVSVGWDVAITSQGPVLVEGNGDSCIDVLQLPHRKPIGDTIIPENPAQSSQGQSPFGASRPDVTVWRASDRIAALQDLSGDRPEQTRREKAPSHGGALP